MRDGDEWVLVGEKTYISNGGIADFYVTFARTGEAKARAGSRAFIVPATRSTIAERIEVIAPHPLARLTYDNVRIPADAIIGEPGEGFRIGDGDAQPVPRHRRRRGARLRAPRARRGAGVREQPPARQRHARRQCGHPGQARRHGARVDASALLIYRAAWQQDEGGARQPPRRGDGQAPRDRSRAKESSTRRCRCTAAPESPAA